MTEHLSTDPQARLRLDKWLWSARFFKTRSLASQAVDAGHVRLNGATAKPSREVKPGDRLEITVGDTRWSVHVTGINPYRRPAAEARALYRETADSEARRAAEREARRLAPPPGSDLRGRPTKKARRQIHHFGEKC